MSNIGRPLQYEPSSATINCGTGKGEGEGMNMLEVVYVGGNRDEREICRRPNTGYTVGISDKVMLSALKLLMVM
jgi:hypothetical protein